ncbi:hypothetical protein PROFUN_04467 [Planoprotostelium fungivorum]|uniref:Enoyl reductase (ER) domain-containing protein n=1 Tax=Planoprotostelium fungivorum TaxID=1890364 RepID=A0A2P6MPH6_9EUKA|nr:hypothetical protein PROFUN_16280 [Planoprotostelium fungivorum]PRP88039.1 hypothetical protein PROFUN_04467 [Planoprotostelium fungivorum]
MKAVTLAARDDNQSDIWHPLHIKELPKPSLDEVSSKTHAIVRIDAAALNHRDIFIRQELYPGWKVGAVLGADGVGHVIEGPAEWKDKRVLIAPMDGWKDDPRGPNGPKRFGTRGGSEPMTKDGTLSEYVRCPVEHLELCPSFLSTEEAAALPLAGLTAYRALFVKCQPQKGWNLLVTGVGGGVAMMAVQFAVAAGLNVWVTSGREDKITKAVSIGARGGVSYKRDDWHRQLKSLLPKERPYLDAVIDSAGGDLVERLCPTMRTGGVISCYGQTTLQPLKLTMVAVLKNIEVKGSTMGSSKDFRDMVRFVDEKRLKPVVSHIVDGLDRVEEAFEIMQKSDQMGKIVVRISSKL